MRIDARGELYHLFLILRVVQISACAGQPQADEAQEQHEPAVEFEPEAELRHCDHRNTREEHDREGGEVSSPLSMEVGQNWNVNECGGPHQEIEGKASGEFRDHNLPVADGCSEERFECARSTFFSDEPRRDDASDGREQSPEQHTRDQRPFRIVCSAKHHLHRILNATRTLLGEQSQREIEQQSGEDQKAEERNVPNRSREVRGELAADEAQGYSHVLALTTSGEFRMDTSTLRTSRWLLRSMPRRCPSLPQLLPCHVQFAAVHSGRDSTSRSTPASGPLA